MAFTKPPFRELFRLRQAMQDHRKVGAYLDGAMRELLRQLKPLTWLYIETVPNAWRPYRESDETIWLEPPVHEPCTGLVVARGILEPGTRRLANLPEGYQDAFGLFVTYDDRHTQSDQRYLILFDDVVEMGWNAGEAVSAAEATSSR